MADVFYFGGHLRLASSCMQVNMVVKNLVMINLPSESSGDRECKIHGNIPGAEEGEGNSNGGGGCECASSFSSVAVAVFLLFLFLLPLWFVK